MCLINVLALKQRNQSFDAAIPLVRDVRQYERQIEYQFVSGHRGQHTVAEEKPELNREMQTAATPWRRAL